MNSLGDTKRKLKENKELPLRTVSVYLDIDQGILSKIERGQRNATQKQVVKLAKHFKMKENDLLVEWFSGKLVYEVQDEDFALQTMLVAEGNEKFNKTHKK